MQSAFAPEYRGRTQSQAAIWKYAQAAQERDPLGSSGSAPETREAGVSASFGCRPRSFPLDRVSSNAQPLRELLKQNGCSEVQDSSLEMEAELEAEMSLVADPKSGLSFSAVMVF